MKPHQRLKICYSELDIEARIYWIITYTVIAFVYMDRDN
jgi:hypothetical protein